MAKIENTKEWDTLLNTLVSYGNEVLHYEQAQYKYFEEKISLIWKTGENSGGNCWGDEASYSAIITQQPHFEILDELLLHIDPDIKLRDYRYLTSKITSEDTSKYEYYGNATYYSQLILDKKDLVDSINQGGYVLNLKDLLSIENYFKSKTLFLINSNKTSSYKKTI